MAIAHVTFNFSLRNQCSHGINKLHNSAVTKLLGDLFHRKAECLFFSRALFFSISFCCLIRLWHVPSLSLSTQLLLLYLRCVNSQSPFPNFHSMIIGSISIAL